MLFFEKEGEERSWMSPNPTEGAGQKHDLPTKVDWRKLGGWFWTEPCIAVHVATQRASTGIAARCIRHCSALRFPVQPSIGNPSALRTMPMGAVRIRFHMPVSTSRPFSQIPRDALKKTAAPLECPAGREVFCSIAVKRVSWHSLRGTAHAPGAPPPRYIRRPAHPVPHRGHRSRSPRGSSRRCPPRGPRRAPHPGNT